MSMRSEQSFRMSKSPVRIRNQQTGSERCAHGVSEKQILEIKFGKGVALHHQLQGQFLLVTRALNQAFFLRLLAPGPWHSPSLEVFLDGMSHAVLDRVGL